jgi:hypothetical protein
MVTFAIFWSALFAIIFFALGTVFKVLAAALSALLAALEKGLYVVGIPALVIVGLILVYMGGGDYIKGVFWDNFWVVIGVIIVMVLLNLFLTGFIGESLLVFLGIFYIAGVGIALLLEHISMAFQGLSHLCEKGYGHFLKAITSRLDRC